MRSTPVYVRTAIGAVPAISSGALVCSVAAPSASVFFNDTATTEIYTLSLHDALPIWGPRQAMFRRWATWRRPTMLGGRSEEHTSELQSLRHLVCRLLLEKKHTADNGIWTPALPQTERRRGNEPGC